MRYDVYAARWGSAECQASGVREPDVEIVADALRRNADTKVDFTDAWLAARAAHFGYGVAFFDQDLDKFKDIQRVEPKAS